MSVAQIKVPESRTTKVRYAPGFALVGTETRPARLGARQLFAVDFLGDWYTNGRLSTLDLVELKAGPGSATIETLGTDRLLAKFWLTGTAAGLVTLRVRVTGTDGHESQADVDYHVS